jgi:hypothetical protein
MLKHCIHSLFLARIFFMAKRVKLSQYMRNILTYNSMTHDRGCLETLVLPSSSSSVDLRFRLPRFTGSGDGVSAGVSEVAQDKSGLEEHVVPSECDDEGTRAK